jgi:hypothetical protein
MLSIHSRACRLLLLENLYSMQSIIGIRVKIAYGALRLETVGGQQLMAMDHSSRSERFSKIVWPTGQATQGLVAGLTSADFGLD